MYINAMERYWFQRFNIQMCKLHDLSHEILNQLAEGMTIKGFHFKRQIMQYAQRL